MTPFQPLFRNSHLQTIAGHYWPRPRADAPVERRLYRTEPEVQVLVCSQRPRGEARGEIFMVHGLEGSGDAGYIRSLSTAALRAGYAAAGELRWAEAKSSDDAVLVAEVLRGLGL